MNRQEAIEWVKTHSDQDDLDREELESAYKSLYGVAADDTDREEGLWSHCCAAVAGDEDAWRYAVASQGCTLTYEEWRAMDDDEREQYERGAAGLPSE